jgi:hypothetical protein
MEDKLLEILKEYVGGDFCGKDECEGWQLKKQEAQAILQAFKESLPEEQDGYSTEHRSIALVEFCKGYNACLRDIKDRLEGRGE